MARTDGLNQSTEHGDGTEARFMRDFTEEFVSTETIFDGRVVHLRRDTVRLANGKLTTREVIHHPGAVCVLPLTESGEAVMVRQYRYPFAATLLEAPAGKLDAGETYADCARRELSEETGVSAKTLIDLGDFYSSVAILDENIRCFLALDLTFSAAHADEDEFLSVARIPLSELYEAVRKGDIRDGKTQLIILKAYLYLLDHPLPSEN